MLNNPKFTSRPTNPPPKKKKKFIINLYHAYIIDFDILNRLPFSFSFCIDKFSFSLLFTCP